MYHEFSTDPKVQMMSEVMQRRLVMLFCMQCGNVTETLHETEVDSAIAFHLRISETEWQQTKDLFIAKGFLNSDCQLLNWDKRQSKKSLRPSAEVWRKIRDYIFRRDNYTCQYCGVRGAKLECDHVIPVAKGGDHEESNLVTACFRCNRSKHTKLLEQWRPT
jgi:5-methylcytosine-specific restriction endonuclease McrA